MNVETDLEIKHFITYLNTQFAQPILKVIDHAGDITGWL